MSGEPVRPTFNDKTPPTRTRGKRGLEERTPEAVRCTQLRQQEVSTMEAAPGEFGARRYVGWGLDARVGALLNLADVAAATYDAVEHPDEGGSMAATAEWFPKLRDALEQAGMLR